LLAVFNVNLFGTLKDIGNEIIAPVICDFDFTTNLGLSAASPEGLMDLIACGSNLGKWYGPCAPDLDALVVQAKKTTNPTDYKNIWKQIQVGMGNEQPSLFLYGPTSVVAANKAVQGFIAYGDRFERQMDEIWLNK
jgi:ABC-type transport system substrate-binding protein